VYVLNAVVIVVAN